MMTKSEQRRAIIAATLGNGLEFYDFIIFAFFAIQIGHTFFPSDNAFLSLMASLTTFGAGFITRPIGAYILGGYADRQGRKPAMIISMLLMGLSTLLLIITPGYHTIGIFAPLIAVLSRLIQGFALGGEIGAATPYLLESADIYKRGQTVAWQGASQQIATTLGALVGFTLSIFMTHEALTSYGWRIALAFGAAIIPFALWIRHSLPETLEIALKSEIEHNNKPQSALIISILGFLIIASGAVGTYIFNYMATFGQNTLKLSTTTSLLAELTLNAAQLITIFIGGWLCDRFGRKSVMVIPQTLFVLAIIPCFLWLTSSPSPITFILSTTLLAILAAPQYTAVYATLNESLPPAIRARYFALIYSIPIAIFGGTTQPFVTWLLHVTGKPITLAWYLTGMSTLGLIAMMLLRESAPKQQPIKNRPVLSLS